jgi:hypothetical protein
VVEPKSKKNYLYVVQEGGKDNISVVTDPWEAKDENDE